MYIFKVDYENMWRKSDKILSKNRWMYIFGDFNISCE